MGCGADRGHLHRGRLRLRRGFRRQGADRSSLPAPTSSDASPQCWRCGRSGVFTAVIQPPLILFVTVPGAYFLFHGGAMDGLKDLLINCGYPLIERFPLMFFTSAIVLLIGMVRWYPGMSSRRAAPARSRRVRGPALGGDVQDLGASGARASDGRGRRGARAAAQQAAFDRPRRQGRQDGCGAQREPAADGPSSAPSRRVRGTLARRRPRSSSPWPSVPVGRAPPAGATEPDVPPAEPRRRPRVTSSATRTTQATAAE